MSRSAVRKYQASPLLSLQLYKQPLRAYVFALLSVTAPRVISLLLSIVRRKNEPHEGIHQICQAIKRQLGIDKLPASFAILLSGAVVLPHAIVSFTSLSLLKANLGKIHWNPTRWHVLRFTCVFMAGLYSFRLLNSKNEVSSQLITSPNAYQQSPRTFHSNTQMESRSRAQQQSEQRVERTLPLAGRTIDLTFFGTVRAADVILRLLWSSFIPRNKSSRRTLQAARIVDRLAGPATFIASCYLIMKAWFYTPHQLPKAYQSWISSAAQLDIRLFEALRECREGIFAYGKDTGRGELLRPLCRELGYPEEWGDPAYCNQVPCAVVHCGTGDNCERHALSRFARSWLFAMRMYLPINILLFIQRNPSPMGVRKTFKEAARSSAFLGTFVALFYYGVCLARRRLGPKLFPNIKPQQMDGGLSVGLGCLLCGTSIFIEKPSRRQEIAFFVAPRALATVFPRQYNRSYMWREQVVYATCAAIILAAAVDSPRQLRGVFGRVLSQVLA